MPKGYQIWSDQIPDQSKLVLVGSIYLGVLFGYQIGQKSLLPEPEQSALLRSKVRQGSVGVNQRSICLKVLHGYQNLKQIMVCVLIFLKFKIKILKKKMGAYFS